MKITQMSWSLLCAEFSTKDNLTQYTHRIALFLLCHISRVHRNYLLTQEQAGGLCLHGSATGGSDLSCCKEACSSIQRRAAPKGEAAPAVGGSPQPLAQLNGPHSCPGDPNLTTAQQGGQQVSQPRALQQAHQVLPRLQGHHEAAFWVGDRELGNLTDYGLTMNAYYWIINHEC